jgi:hypothetical protein
MVCEPGVEKINNKNCGIVEIQQFSTKRGIFSAKNLWNRPFSHRNVIFFSYGVVVLHLTTFLNQIMNNV